jgi:hypothetical protein
MKGKLSGKVDEMVSWQNGKSITELMKLQANEMISS